MSDKILILGERVVSGSAYLEFFRSLGFRAKWGTLLPVREGFLLRLPWSGVFSVEPIFVGVLRRTLLPALVRLSDKLLEARIRALLKRKWRVVFLYGDVSHRLVKVASRVLATGVTLEAKLVVGLHNHHLSRRTSILRLLDSADSLVFLSEDSRDYYLSLVETLKGKPCEFIPSLYLPLFDEWERFERSSGGRLRAPSAFIAERNVKIGLGGRYITAVPGEESRGQVGRYNFVRHVEFFGYQSATVIVFGEPKAEVSPVESLPTLLASDMGLEPVPPVHDIEVTQIYAGLAERFPSIRLRGTTGAFEQSLIGLDFFICKGFLPGDSRMSSFENMNYQLRYTSTLFAGVPVLVARGTDKILEEQIEAHGFGLVYESLSDLSKEYLVDVRSSFTEAMLKDAREMNSLNTYEGSFLKLLNA